MSPEAARYFGWMYLRALLWIALIAFPLYRLTRNVKVSQAFVAAHLLALFFGAATDIFLVYFAPKSWLRIEVLQWVFTAPIAIFTVISLWIADWERPVTAADVFITLAPVVLWGFMVIYGWQSMWDCHVLGAWFVSAACGGVDLAARYGAAGLRHRPLLTRAAGYVLVLVTVYLLLPKT